MLQPHSFIAAEHVAQSSDPDESKFGLQHALALIGPNPVCVKPCQITASDLQAAVLLIRAGQSYQNAICTMIQAFNGDLNAEVLNSDLRLAGPPKYCEYEVLDLAVDLSHQDSQYSDQPSASIRDALRVPLSRTLIVDGGEFFIPRIPDSSREFYLAIGQGASMIPDAWTWRGLQGSEVRRILCALSSYAVERESLVKLATERFHLPTPPPNSFLERFGKTELCTLLAHITHLPQKCVAEVLNPLVYNVETETPDPALQPLFPTKDDELLLPLTLVGSSRIQRNYLKLAGRIDKPAFDDSSSVFSEAMVNRVQVAFEQLPGVVVRSGVAIPGAAQLGDLDLVVFSPTENTCLIVELKWSLDAAETREIVRQRQTVIAGSDRVKQRLDYLRSSGNQLVRDSGLTTDQPWTFDGVVVHSQMNLGSHNGVSVVSEHLLRLALNEQVSLRETIAWYVNETFLPRRGVEFFVKPRTEKLGRTSFQWAALSIDFEAVLKRVTNSLRAR